MHVSTVAEKADHAKMGVAVGDVASVAVAVGKMGLELLSSVATAPPRREAFKR